MMNKIIFLDIDGVLNNEESRYILSPKLMDNLGYILEKTDAMIVVSSSWRGRNVEDTIKTMTDTTYHYVGDNPFPYADKIIGITKRLSINDPSKEYSRSIPRGCEIDEYINRNNIDKYVILDDDSDFLIYQQPNFVKTKCNIGLTKEDAEKAILILNS